MNICQCGAAAGYPHQADCPFPLFNEGQVEKWYLERKLNKLVKTCDLWLEKGSFRHYGFLTFQQGLYLHTDAQGASVVFSSSDVEMVGEALITLDVNSKQKHLHERN